MITSTARELDTNTSGGTRDNCPIWSSQDSCDCNTNHYPHIVQCLWNDSSHLRILNCHCIWYDESSSETILSACPHTCYTNIVGSLSYEVDRTDNYTEFNRKMCSGTYFGLDLHRQARSRLCGRCEDGYGISVYSYQYSECVFCPSHWYNYFVYAAVAFGPLTIFYIVVITFRISATSGNLNGYIFFSQVITSPLYMKLFVSALHTKQHYNHNGIPIKIIYTLYSIWNLDFFRLLHKPLCLNPHSSAQHVISMDYLVAIYPIFLIAATYGFVVLHERDYKLLVLLWKPFHRFFARFRSQWNIKTSLVHAFSTFILLSYVKTLTVSIDLLLPTVTYGSRLMEKRLYYYYDPTINLTSGHNSLYIIMSLVTILLCTIPLLLLLAYPCRCFHRNCNITNPKFHIFMDTFTGCYREKPAYCKAFAGIYLLLRIVLTSVFEVTLSLAYMSVVSALIMFAAILFAVVGPNKKRAHNITDVAFLIYLAICFNCQAQVHISELYNTQSSLFVYIFVVLLGAPILYPTFLTLRFLRCSSLVYVQGIKALCKHYLRQHVHRVPQELVDTVEVDRGHYGSIVTVDGH